MKRTESKPKKFGKITVTYTFTDEEGNDPAPTNPVYVRIGKTIKKITSPLSVSQFAGRSIISKANQARYEFDVPLFMAVEIEKIRKSK